MARLRTLNIGTEKIGDVETDRCILILDQCERHEAEAVANVHRQNDPGVPPILAFDFTVELPGQKPRDVVLDINHGDDTAMKNLVRKTVRDDPSRYTPDLS